MISLAIAQATSATESAGGFTQFLPLIAMFAVIWFVMIRPQMKKAKDHKAMVESLQIGDEVLLQAGITGKITQIGESYLHVEVAKGIELTIQKLAVGALLPKGTLRDL